MTNLKDICEFSVTWEIQDNKKVNHIFHCEKSEANEVPGLVGDQELSSGSSTTLASGAEHEAFNSSIHLKPFLHPEMTKAKHCELRLFVPWRHRVRLGHLIVVSTSKDIELYDRNSEFLTMVRGEKLSRRSTVCREVAGGAGLGTTGSPVPSQMPPNGSGSGLPSHQPSLTSRWYRAVYTPDIDCCEVVIKFIGNLDPNLLLIRYLGVHVLNHDWQPQLQQSHDGAVGAGGLPFPLHSPLLMGGGVATPGHAALTEVLTGLLTSTDQTQAQQGGKSGTAPINISLLANLLLAVAGASGSLPPSTSTSGASTGVRSSSPNPSALFPTSDSPGGGNTPRRSLDYTHLRAWLETRLAAMEANLMTSLEVLNQRLDRLEMAAALGRTKELGRRSGGTQSDAAVPPADTNHPTE